MDSHDFLFQTFIYLLAAVVSVPLAKRVGLGSVLGYLIAGVIIGPCGFHLVGQEKENVRHVAEFGVVMMLFLVGLELRPNRLWELRGPIFGTGSLQVVVTTLVVAAIAVLCGIPVRTAIVTGMIVSASSTAIALQSLAERGQLQTKGGQTSFSVLLFQDLAVIPMLALIPLLRPGSHLPTGVGGGQPTRWIHARPEKNGGSRDAGSDKNRLSPLRCPSSAGKRGIKPNVADTLFQPPVFSGLAYERGRRSTSSGPRHRCTAPVHRRRVGAGRAH